MAMLTKWFDDEIILRQVKPDVKGQSVFTILKTDFIAISGRTTIDRYFRKILKMYGYKAIIHGKLVEIIKLRQ